jgi:hypothetical protein
MSEQEQAWLELRVIRAVDAPALSQEFAAEQRRALREFVGEELTTASLRWVFDPQVYVITARWRPSRRLAAGVRLHLARPSPPLPMLAAWPEQRLARWVEERRADGGLGEMSGLWAAREARGLGLPRLLLQVGMALGGRLGLAHLCSFVPEHSRGFMLALGWEEQPELTPGGAIPYPDARYQTRVMWLDPIAPGQSPPQVRAQVAAFRSQDEHQLIHEGLRVRGLLAPAPAPAPEPDVDVIAPASPLVVEPAAQ